MDNDDLIRMLSEEEDDDEETKDKEIEDNEAEEKDLEEDEDIEETPKTSAIDILNDETKELSEKSEKEDISTDLDVIQTGVVNTGSGDLDVDLDDWYEGVKLTPSENLTRYVSGGTLKMQYGLSKSTLNNFSIMNKLKKFIEEAGDVLFSETEMLQLTPSELEERMKMAFTMYSDLNRINQRTVISLNEQARKYNKGKSDVDKLAILLSSISNEKLKKLLDELNKKN
jgi:hypothetical protein|nr:MAG TPA: hypothetical protein [Bacteriophage sp.]